jgi:DNA-binding CsgD family transcriptional regulator
MGALLKKLWTWLLQKNHMIIVIILLLLFGMGATIYFQHKSILNLKDKYQTEVKLKDALLDSNHYYINKRGEWVVERLSLQESLKNLEKMNGQLTTSQKEMLARIEDLNKSNTTIAAALIKSQVTIDSLLSHSSAIIDSVNKNLTFRDSVLNKKKEAIFKYDITINKAVPAFASIKPTIMFNNITLPNTQFIEFHWKNEKKIGYPIAFSVTNSNDLFKTTNIDSYVIPEIKKETVKPSFWNNLGTFFNTTGGKVLWFGIGGLAGAEAYHLLTK